LVHVTPPVKVVQHTTFCEAKWEPGKMPLRYADAPLLIDIQGNTQVPSLKERIRPLDRTTWLGRFASAFRSRCTPVVKDLAKELIAAHRRQSAKRGVVAKSYVEALPRNPPKPDTDRKAKYQKLSGARKIRGC